MLPSYLHLAANRTNLELKLVFYKEHKSYYIRCQSHQSGIETSLQMQYSYLRYTANRTNLELKHKTTQGKVIQLETCQSHQSGIETRIS